MSPGHGTRARYLRGCRCPACSKAHSRYMGRYRLDRERGIDRRVPAGPAADHVRALLDEGWSLTQVGTMARVNRHTIGNLAEGRQEQIRPAHEACILAVPVGPPPFQRDVDGTGTRRRLQALCAIGYPIVAIADDVGVTKSALARIARGEQATIRSDTAVAVARVYRRLALTAGPSKRARILAGRQGWHGPMAWDSLTIDDPDAQPDDGPVDEEPSTTGAAVLVEELRHLDGFNLSDAEIARKLGRSESYIRELRRERLHRAA